MGEVVRLEQRAAQVAEFLHRKEATLRIETIREAISYGDKWQAHAHRLEAMLALVTAQRDASSLLLSMAEDELLKYRGLSPATD